MLPIILSIQILSVSVPNQDTINPKNLSAADTISDSAMVEIRSDTIYPNDQKKFYNDADPSRVSSGCVWNYIQLICSIITVLISICALRRSILQAKQSSDQANKSYNSFIEKSDRQFEAQKATLETIRNQTDKIYINNNKRDFVGHLCDCSTSVGLIITHLKTKASSILWEYNNEDYVFKLLQPTIASAAKMTVSIASKQINEEVPSDLSKAIKTCSTLGKWKPMSFGEIESMIKELENHKTVFDSFLDCM